RVKEIKQLNAQGVKPDDLQPVELTTSKESEHNFVDVVGHLTINNLEKTSQRNKERQRNQKRNENIKQQKPNSNQRDFKQNPQQRPNQNRPPQNNRNKPPQKGR
ncbi:MAG TPA: hypothetical protein VHB70_12010, partial [Parafilimonas sp.]|nr:hypothetical protein [Parafilimonas sp.]